MLASPGSLGRYKFVASVRKPKQGGRASSRDQFPEDVWARGDARPPWQVYSPRTLDFGPGTLEVGLEIDGYAFVRIRALRRRLRSVWREVHLAPAAISPTFDQVPGVQEAGAAGVVHLQLTQGTLDFRRQEGRLCRAQTREQGRVRAPVNREAIGRCRRAAACRPSFASRQARLLPGCGASSASGFLLPLPPAVCIFPRHASAGN